MKTFRNNDETSQNDWKPNKFHSGTRNWALLLFISMCISEAVDNYSTYGIIKTPVELTKDGIYFFYNWGWVFPVVFCSLILQFCICIFTEKLLLWKRIGEKLGLVVNICNTFLVLNVLGFISTYYKLNCVFGTWIAGNFFLLAIKQWSFSSENRNLRLKYHRNAFVNSESNKLIYPENIKLINLVDFVIGSGNFLYKPERCKKRPREWKIIFSLFVQITVILYVAAFVIYQYGITTSDDLIRNISFGNYVKVVGSFWKLLVIVCIVWILIFYQYVFKCYLPLLSLLCGNENNMLHMKSWWNSTNMANVWSSWNVQSHYVFRHHVFQPLIDAGYSKQQATFLVTLISGIMHEYMVTIPFRSSYGTATVAMLFQMITCPVTAMIEKKYGDSAGNFSTLAIHLIWQTSCYFFVYYHYIYNEYGGLH